MDTPDARCALIAAEQHGCISLSQARKCRLSERTIRRRVEKRRWERVLPGVYVIRGAPATWEQRLFAAVLWAGEGAAVSGLSAARLWELPGMSAGAVEISHPSRRSRKPVRCHGVRLPAKDVTRVRIFPVTSPERTVRDISGRLRRGQLDAVVHHCLFHRLTTVEALRAQVAACGKGCSGVGALRAALAPYQADSSSVGSPLEAALARKLASSGLARPRRQHEVVVEGRRRYLDFAWPDCRVAVEVDGYRWHSSRSAWESDRARLAALRRAGWTIIHATYDDVHPGAARLIGELKTLLRAKSAT